MEKRDSRDVARRVAPLRQAEDAVLVDSTHLDTEQVVELIVNKANAIIEGGTFS
ncbi:(d)CMP kinase [bacterium]|nr:(d)CMP kinase [bacterium]